MKVLVVDNNEELLQFLILSLEEATVEAVGAKGTNEALEYVKEEKFDGIIIDASLGGDDGITLAHQIREQKNGKNVPLIIMSSFSTPLARRMAKSVGCDEILVKPFGVGQFTERVRTLR
jgi:two-component system response regulator VicR